MYICQSHVFGAATKRCLQFSWQENIHINMHIILVCCWLYQFQMSQDYFQSVAGGILVDVSCGSGLFSRKFASSGAYSAVIALDFSENMLRQCYDYIRQEETPMNTWAFLSAYFERFLWGMKICLATSNSNKPSSRQLGPSQIFVWKLVIILV